MVFAVRERGFERGDGIERVERRSRDVYLFARLLFHGVQSVSQSVSRSVRV